MSKVIGQYNGLDVYDDIPEGFKYSKDGSPLTGYSYIINGSPLMQGFKRAFAPTKIENFIAPQRDKRDKICFNNSKKKQAMHPQAPKAMNRLSREKQKEILLRDIMSDMMVCEIEGWDKTEYINELKELIDSIGKATSDVRTSNNVAG